MASDEQIFNFCLYTIIFLTPITFIGCLITTAPYGKHRRAGWGPTVSPAVAWFLMESPTLWFTLLLFPFGRHCRDLRALVMISPFLFHYVHRTLIYPLRISRLKKGVNGPKSPENPKSLKTDVKSLKIHPENLKDLKTDLTSPENLKTPKKDNGYPISVALMAFAFNMLNSYLQVRWVSEYASYEGNSSFWLRFGFGLVVFGTGMVVNVKSDIVLLRLKSEATRPGSSSGCGYKVPRGGLFELVSCANYFGEIVEWLGWAIMTWSLPGLSFFLYTCANLVPRALANHKWYLEKFGEDYPKSRKAVIPFLL